MQELWVIISTISLSDVLDIAIVAVPFYLLFTLLREARSFFALWGIVSMLLFSSVIYLIARVLDLQATILIYERFWIIVVLVFLIIFQGELKKAMTDVGRLRIFRAFFPRQRQVVGEIIRAVQTMAERKVGALIAVERSNTLKPYLASGTMLDSAISAELLRSVFQTNSPLHDGAVIVSGDRIVAAACILPLSENPRLGSELGTRHRAAIGLSEETDALVVVVSEETGTISVAEEGKMERFLEPADLRKRIEIELDLSTADERT